MAPPLRILIVILTAAALVAGCGGSSSESSVQSTTSFPYVTDPLDPGTGFVELDGNRFIFDEVICATGPADGDPEGSTRVFGVYANFDVDGTLATVALTRYHNEIHDKIDTVPTVTETAVVRMQGEGEILGLSAKRFQVVGQRNWQDPTDPEVTEPLIAVEGDRYEVDASFTGGDDGADRTVPDAGASPDATAAAGATPGRIAARCPAGSPVPTSQPAD